MAPLAPAHGTPVGNHWSRAYENLNPALIMFCPKYQQLKEYSLHWLNIEDFPEIVCLWKGTKPIFHDRVADDVLK